jgi:hypothetical protein
MAIDVTRIYVGKDLARSHESGFQQNVLAEAEVVVTLPANGMVFQYAGVKIISKKDGGGLSIAPPSQRNLDPAGATVYLDYYNIPKEWFPKMKDAVLAEYEKWAASDGTPKDVDYSDDDLQDPFANP